MKQLVIAFALIMICHTLYAQKGKVTRAYSLMNSGDLGKALEIISLAVDPENGKSAKTINWPRTWMVRGEIFQAVYHSKNEHVKSLCNDPLNEALSSYNKALQLDSNNKIVKGLKVNLTLLINDFQDEAIKSFNNNEFKKALSSFEKVLEIKSLSIIKTDDPTAVDTAIIFNAGLAASNAQEYDKAIKLYKQASDYGYNGAVIYIQIANTYKLNKDTISALETLKQGFEKYKDNNEVLGEMIQTCVDIDRREEALKYLDIAIKRSPGNANYYCVMGALNEKNDDEIRAIEFYDKAIGIDPELFLAYYNSGVIYYNKGVNQVKIADNIPANDYGNYEKELNKADEWWERSLPFMEKCHEIDPSERNTMEVLKTLYYRLKQLDKYNLMLEKLK